MSVINTKNDIDITEKVISILESSFGKDNLQNKEKYKDFCEDLKDIQLDKKWTEEIHKSKRIIIIFAVLVGVIILSLLIS